MIGFASRTQRRLMTTQAATVNVRAVTSTWLASSRRFSPRRRATRADTATLVAINRDSPRNFGWVVSPTAATA